MRLIDADALINELIECKQGYIGTHNDVVLHDLMCDNAISWADGAETINAVPVRHGRWVKLDLVPRFTNYCCSLCKCHAPYDTAYCPHCGAKMDEVI